MRPSFCHGLMEYGCTGLAVLVPNRTGAMCAPFFVTNTSTVSLRLAAHDGPESCVGVCEPELPRQTPAHDHRGPFQ